MKEKDRRKALKTLAAAPAVWAKPVVDNVILPAHASTTICNCAFFEGASGPFTKSTIDIVIPTAHASLPLGPYFTLIPTGMCGDLMSWKLLTYGYANSTCTEPPQTEWDVVGPYTSDPGITPGQTIPGCTAIATATFDLLALPCAGGVFVGYGTAP